jgi:hypothetical protein
MHIVLEAGVNPVHASPLTSVSGRCTGHTETAGKVFAMR